LFVGGCDMREKSEGEVQVGCRWGVPHPAIMLHTLCLCETFQVRGERGDSPFI